MERSQWKSPNLKRLDGCLWIGILILVLMQIFCLFSPERSTRIRSDYMLPMVLFMLSYVFLRKGWPRMPVLVLPLVFAGWYVLTRVLNGDHYLAESQQFVYMVVLSCGVLLPAPLLLDQKRRARYFGVLALVYSLIFSVIAWVAVIAALSGIPWVNPLDNTLILGFNEGYSNPYRLNVLNTHPNISAVFFYTTLALLVYLFLRTRKVWVRIGYVALGIGNYLAICMTGSISAVVIMGIIFGMTLFAVILGHGPRKPLRVTAAALAMVAVVVAVVLTYPLIIEGSTALYKTIRQQNTANAGFSLLATASAEDTAAAQAEPEAEPEVFAEERLNADTMIGTMQGRFQIYSSAFLSVADRPLTLLIGEMRQAAMDRSARVVGLSYQSHLHNSFLQTLVVGGGISCLLAIAFTVLLVLHCIRLFFGKAVPLYNKVLVLIPVTLLCHSMTESILFIDERLPNMLFFLVAGMVIAYSKEMAVKPAATEQTPE